MEAEDVTRRLDAEKAGEPVLGVWLDGSRESYVRGEDAAGVG